jgi:hypothetical protein
MVGILLMYGNGNDVDKDAGDVEGDDLMDLVKM